MLRKLDFLAGYYLELTLGAFSKSCFQSKLLPVIGSAKVATGGISLSLFFSTAEKQIAASREYGLNGCCPSEVGKGRLRSIDISFGRSSSETEVIGR